MKLSLKTFPTICRERGRDRQAGVEQLERQQKEALAVKEQAEQLKKQATQAGDATAGLLKPELDQQITNSLI